MVLLGASGLENALIILGTVLTEGNKNNSNKVDISAEFTSAEAQQQIFEKYPETAEKAGNLVAAYNDFIKHKLGADASTGAEHRVTVNDMAKGMLIHPDGKNITLVDSQGNHVDLFSGKNNQAFASVENAINFFQRESLHYKNELDNIFDGREAGARPSQKSLHDLAPELVRLSNANIEAVNNLKVLYGSEVIASAPYSKVISYRISEDGESITLIGERGDTGSFSKESSTGRVSASELIETFQNQIKFSHDEMTEHREEQAKIAKEHPELAKKAQNLFDLESDNFKKINELKLGVFDGAKRPISATDCALPQKFILSDDGKGVTLIYENGEYKDFYHSDRLQTRVAFLEKENPRLQEIVSNVSLEQAKLVKENPRLFSQAQEALQEYNKFEKSNAILNEAQGRGAYKLNNAELATKIVMNQDGQSYHLQNANGKILLDTDRSVSKYFNSGSQAYQSYDVSRAAEDFFRTQKEGVNKQIANLNESPLFMGSHSTESDTTIANVLGSERAAKNSDSKSNQSIEKISAVVSRVGPLSPDFPEVVVPKGTNIGELKKDPRWSIVYNAAKNGDISNGAEAAYKWVDRTLTEDTIDSLKSIAGDKNLVLVPVYGGEKPNGRLNMIPLAYSEVLAHRTGWEVMSPDIIRAESSGRTKQSGIERFINQPEFTLAPDVKQSPVVAGQAYIVVDDHVTQGGTVRSLINYIEVNGGTVICATTLGAGRNSELMKATQKSLNRATSYFGKEGFVKFHHEYFGLEGELPSKINVNDVLFTKAELDFINKHKEGSLDELRRQITGEQRQQVHRESAEGSERSSRGRTEQITGNSQERGATEPKLQRTRVRPAAAIEQQNNTQKETLEVAKPQSPAVKQQELMAEIEKLSKESQDFRSQADKLKPGSEKGALSVQSDMPKMRAQDLLKENALPNEFRDKVCADLDLFTAHRGNRQFENNIHKLNAQTDLSARCEVSEKYSLGSRDQTINGYFKASLDGKPAMLYRGWGGGQEQSKILNFYDQLAVDNPKMLEALPKIHGTAERNGLTYLVMEDLSVGAIHLTDQPSLDRSAANRFVADYGDSLTAAGRDTVSNKGMNLDRYSFEHDYTFVNKETGQVRVGIPYRASEFVDSMRNDYLITSDNTPSLESYAARQQEIALDRAHSLGYMVNEGRTGNVLVYNFDTPEQAKSFSQSLDSKVYNTAIKKADGATMIAVTRKDAGVINPSDSGIDYRPDGASSMHAANVDGKLGGAIKSIRPDVITQAQRGGSRNTIELDNDLQKIQSDLSTLETQAKSSAADMASSQSKPIPKPSDVFKLVTDRNWNRVDSSQGVYSDALRSGAIDTPLLGKEGAADLRKGLSEVALVDEMRALEGKSPEQYNKALQGLDSELASRGYDGAKVIGWGAEALVLETDKGDVLRITSGEQKPRHDASQLITPKDTFQLDGLVADGKPVTIEIVPKVESLHNLQKSGEITLDQAKFYQDQVVMGLAKEGYTASDMFTLGGGEKYTNVGLAADGKPYVIDPGSIGGVRPDYKFSEMEKTIPANKAYLEHSASDKKPAFEWSKPNSVSVEPVSDTRSSTASAQPKRSAGAGKMSGLQKVGLAGDVLQLKDGLEVLFDDKATTSQKVLAGTTTALTTLEGGAIVANKMGKNVNIKGLGYIGTALLLYDGANQIYSAVDNAKTTEEAWVNGTEATARFGISAYANIATAGIAGGATDKLLDGFQENLGNGVDLGIKTYSMVSGDIEWDGRALKSDLKSMRENANLNTAAVMYETLPGQFGGWVGQKLTGADKSPAEMIGQIKATHKHLEEKYENTNINYDAIHRRDPLKPPSPTHYRNLAEVMTGAVNGERTDTGSYQTLGANGIETAYDPAVIEKALNAAQKQLEKKADEKGWSGAKDVNDYLLASLKGPVKEEFAAYKRAHEKWEAKHGEEYKKWRDDQPMHFYKNHSIAEAAVKNNPEVEGFVKTANGGIEFTLKGYDKPVTLAIGEGRILENSGTIAQVIEHRQQRIAERQEDSAKPLNINTARGERIADAVVRNLTGKGFEIATTYTDEKGKLQKIKGYTVAEDGTISFVRNNKESLTLTDGEARMAASGMSRDQIAAAKDAEVQKLEAQNIDPKTRPDLAETQLTKEVKEYGQEILNGDANGHASLAKAMRIHGKVEKVSYNEGAAYTIRVDGVETPVTVAMAKEIIAGKDAKQVLAENKDNPSLAAAQEEVLAIYAAKAKPFTLENDSDKHLLTKIIEADRGNSDSLLRKESAGLELAPTAYQIQEDNTVVFKNANGESFTLTRDEVEQIGYEGRSREEVVADREAEIKELQTAGIDVEATRPDLASTDIQQQEERYGEERLSYENIGDFSKGLRDKGVDINYHKDNYTLSVDGVEVQATVAEARKLVAGETPEKALANNESYKQGVAEQIIARGDSVLTPEQIKQATEGRLNDIAAGKEFSVLTPEQANTSSEELSVLGRVGSIADIERQVDTITISTDKTDKAANEPEQPNSEKEVAKSEPAKPETSSDMETALKQAKDSGATKQLKDSQATTDGEKLENAQEVSPALVSNASPSAAQGFSPA